MDRRTAAIHKARMLERALADARKRVDVEWIERVWNASGLKVGPLSPKARRMALMQFMALCTDPDDLSYGFLGAVAAYVPDSEKIDRRKLSSLLKLWTNK